jgi:Ni/Co efflux regulator RcnB
MKKLLIISLAFFASSFFLSSCGSANADTHAKTHVQNNEDTTAKKDGKKSDKHEKKEKKEKKDKKHEKTSFFKLTRPINEANTKMIYETQTALWL